jgi:hypothetical protein
VNKLACRTMERVGKAKSVTGLDKEMDRWPKES